MESEGFVALPDMSKVAPPEGAALPPISAEEIAKFVGSTNRKERREMKRRTGKWFRGTNKPFVKPKRVVDFPV